MSRSDPDREQMSITGSGPVRGTALAALLVFLAILVVYIDRPGYTPARLVLFAGLGAAAVLGTAGVVTQRSAVAALGGVLLALLGVWQATLWIFVLPMAGVLGAASLLIALDERTVEER